MRRFLAVIAVLLCATPLFAAAGDLDCTFGTGGIVKVDFGNSSEFVNDVVVRPDGKIITLSNGGYLARFDSSGALDPTFGVAGRASVPFGGWRMALDSVGRIVVGGVTNNDVVVARFTPDGVLDTSFAGGNGWLQFDFSAPGTLDFFAGVAVDAADRIVVGGSSDTDASYGHRVFAFARLTMSGAFDTSFNGTGKWTETPSAGQDDWMYAMTVQNDGKPVGAGNRGFATNPRDHMVIRLTSAGTPDTTFGTNGMTIWNAGSLGGTISDDFAYSVAVDGAQRIVVGGGAALDLVSRLTPSGVLDTSFNGNGVVGLNFGGQNGGEPRLAIQGDDKILVTDLVYPSGFGFHTGLARLTTSGALDATFSDDGLVVTRAATQDYAYAIALQPDDKIVIGGGGSNGGAAGYDYMLQRYLNDHNASSVTTTTITSDTPDPSYAGQSVTVNFTVTAEAGAPDGTVTVRDGANSCSAPVAAGSCSLVLTTPGTRTLTASYGGGTNFCPSSGATSHVVNAITTTTTITTATPNPSTIFSPITIGVTVSSPAGTPTGTVIVNDSGAGTACTITLSNGSGTCNYTAITGGTRNLIANYQGDGTFPPSASTAVSHTYDKVGSSLTIVAHDPDPSAPGQGVTVVVALSRVDNHAAIIGSVSVSDGQGAGCTAPVVVTGQGICVLAPATPGPRTMTAVYNGTSQYLGSSASAQHTVSQATPAVAIASHTPDPSIVGDPVSVSVTVGGVAGAGTGNVTVSSGTATCNATLVSGQGNCSLVLAQVGTPSINASYAGDASYLPGSATVSHTVNKAASSLAITAGASSIVGAPLSVSVAASSGYGVPGGSVTISDGQGAQCTATLAGGTGSCDLTALVAGSRNISASYSGDGDHDGSSAAVPHQFDKASSSTSITAATPDPSDVGSPLSIAVSVSGPGAGITGSVTIDDGAGASCTASLVNGGASCTLTPLVAGARSISATYGGDDNHSGSTGSLGHQFDRAATSTTVLAQPSSYVGVPVTVSIAVSGPAGPIGGSAIVSDGQGASCTAAIVNGGGTCDLTPLVAGTRNIAASYSGDANHAASSGAILHAFDKGASSVQITDATPEPSPIGTDVTVTMSVSGAGASLTGSVLVSDGEGATCSAAITAGTIECVLHPSIAGDRDITATYGGDANHDGSSASVAHHFLKAASSVAIVSDDPDPSPAGASVVVSVTVASSAGTPTGSVAISDGSATCTASLTNGAGSCALVLTIPGARTLSATYSGDANFLGSTATAEHAVIDVVAPVFVKVTPSRTALWPPNHSLIPVTFTAEVTDDFDPSPEVRIIAVRSNQAVNGKGDGNTSADWQITGPLSVLLRSERSGKGGDRIYTVTLEAVDASGNRATHDVQIRAPQHQ